MKTVYSIILCKNISNDFGRVTNLRGDLLTSFLIFVITISVTPSSLLSITYSSSCNLTPAISHYSRDQPAVMHLENVHQLNIRRCKKRGFQLSCEQPHKQCSVFFIGYLRHLTERNFSFVILPHHVCFRSHSFQIWRFFFLFDNTLKLLLLLRFFVVFGLSTRESFSCYLHNSASTILVS